MPTCETILPSVADDAPTAQLSCRQCGLPTSHGSEFCCSGCAFVFRLIHEEELEQYYHLKDNVTAPAEAALQSGTDFSWLREAQKDAERSGGEPLLRLEILGISCVACVWLIEKVF